MAEINNEEKITKIKYDEIIENIKRCLNFYENVGFVNNKYSLKLANGEIINIKFLMNNIPHLLGVNIDYLKTTTKFKPSNNAYENLKYFVDENYMFYRMMNEGKIKANLMFSKNIEKKLEYFIDNIRVRTDDMICIIKYDSEKTYQQTEVSDICDYYIVRKTQEGKNLVLGLIKNDQSKYPLCFPVTSRCYDSDEELDKFLTRVAKKQELTYVNILTIDNPKQIPLPYHQKFIPKLEEKTKTLDIMTGLSQKYDSTISVGYALQFEINKAINEKNQQKMNMQILKEFKNYILSGNIFDNDIIEQLYGEVTIDSVTQDVINAYNDVLVSGQLNTNNDDDNTYTEITNKNKELKEELEETKRLLEESKQTIEGQKEYIKKLEEENNIYKKSFEAIEKNMVKTRKLITKE